MTRPNASDTKPFVPAQDFDASLNFYLALGWTLNWQTDGLVELELADSRLLLQDFYVEAWAHNWMLYVVVEDADAWHRHACDVIATQSHGSARTQPPCLDDHGALVTYVWDPSGVLIHFAQQVSL